MLQRRTWVVLAIFSIFLLAESQDQSTSSKLKVIHSWKSLEFLFPSERARESAIRHGYFVPGAPVPIDVDVYHGGKNKSKIFVTIPRFQDGVPVTLGYVTNNVTSEGNPIIAPYPDWEWNRLDNCNAITSVYRVQIDPCGRLWVLDTGILVERQVCRPQLLAFSLDTNKLYTRYKFPNEQFTDESIFVTPIVDVRDSDGKCSDTFVYIADVTGFAIIVYDHKNARSWKITNNLFYPYPPYGTFYIKNESFDLMDGIIGLALSPLKANGDRILYFHSLASRVESWVSTSIIRNYSLFENDPEAAARSFQPFEVERSSQSAAEAMDRNGVLFFGLMSDLAIGCWNSKDYQYGGSNIEKVVVNADTLQFASGLKVVTSKNGRQELWVMTDSFQRYMTGTLMPNETSFRIQATYIDELVRGTKCDVTSFAARPSQLLFSDKRPA